MAREDREQIHWAWLPGAAVFLIGGWLRFRPIVALSIALAGLGLGFALRKRGERRREAQWLAHEGE